MPEKFTIYPEYLPIWVRAGDGPTPYDRIAAGIKQAGRATFIDLRPALRAEKDQRRLYFKTDSHWNYNGAVIGYRELMRTVQQGLPRGALPTIAPAPRRHPLPASTGTTGIWGRCSACQGWCARTM